jgi:hypothetical protein
MVKKVHIILIALLLIVVCFIYLGIILRDYYSHAEETISKPTNITLYHDTITVIFIGDSWAAYHSQFDQHLKICIESKINKPTKVISKGTVGAKTKTIYAKMHADSPSGTSGLINLFPDYAIISAGINDAVAKMGTANYCHHYQLIIKELLSAGIKPIIIDMPQVDYRAVYQRESMTAKIRHHISSWYTGAPFWTFDEYREALQLLISQGEIKKQLIYIPASEWNPEGYMDSRILYKDDHVHLNEKGYNLLDSCIASYIYKDLKPTRGFQ